VNELALFAGAGGGILGTQLLGIRTICAVEYHPHAASVLAQRQNDGCLPSFPVWDDIHTFNAREWRGRVHLISGGFPCQAFSTAASGRNNADDLWPEMRRVVADVAPWYVFAENVSAKAIEYAAEDCRAMGYETRAIPLSAADLGGDHIRERYWLLAYADDKSQLRRAINAKVGLCSRIRAGVWETEPDESGVVDGAPGRVDRYRATGNGQIPAVAATALAVLANCE
jgi:DNA (cytosine-5)-methyltransferase 1